MDIMEKVELLREKANITYEEAKMVLDEADGDLLNAMILLESRGKIKKPETEVTLFSGEEASGKTAEKAGGKTASESKTAENRKTCEAGKVQRTMRKIINVLKNNFFNISRKGELLFQMPAWAFALILLFFWEPVIPIMLIALFFDVRYQFTGKDDMSGANHFMDKVGSMAEEMSSEF